MDSKRRCTKSSCEAPAAATLTYSYQDSTIVVGPISVYAEPHTYDLCTVHADAVNPPRGWEVLRLNYAGAGSAASEADDDLLALADAVREPSRPAEPSAAPAGPVSAGARTPGAPLAPPPEGPGISRGHLRLLRD